jgi:hypothetical protein
MKNELARESELFVFSDGPKTEKDESKVKEVREYIKTIKGFRKVEIIERDRNFGLANNIIDGVTKIVNEYRRIIVLEDDLITSPYFLTYMNKALEIYQDEEKVASIHGYVYPLPNPEKLPYTFFIRGADCWGWATWERAWKLFEADGKKLLNLLIERKETKIFDFNDSYGYTKMLKDQIQRKNDSWGIRWYASAFLNNMFTLYPRKTLVRNIGADNSGTHCITTDIFDGEIAVDIILEKLPVKENEEARKQFECYLSNNSRFSFRIIWNMFRRRVL